MPIDESGTNQAALDAVQADRAEPIIIRQIKSLNNMVEQDHRAINRITRPMLDFKSFHSATRVLGWHRTDAHDSPRAEDDAHSSQMFYLTTVNASTTSSHNCVRPRAWITRVIFYAWPNLNSLNGSDA